MQLEGSSSVCPTTGLPDHAVTNHAVIPPSKNFILWLILLPSYSPEHCGSAFWSFIFSFITIDDAKCRANLHPKFHGHLAVLFFQTSINQFHHLPVNVQLSILQW
ncbi:hypothetical protein PCASD_13736 [Puccinia coronata f. sp. avenae]|uniref:Uncharacterized protein n=1 Tax=Puccinia coronata f. sp. avenae TaxID=200324 RepID=A0A2N5TB44_9BASI|nr:hypothetical protein PCASD_13736 [Puccinia coronata f. sp. avenae]